MIRLAANSSISIALGTNFSVTIFWGCRRFSDRARLRQTVAELIEAPSRYPLYLFGSRFVEILQRQKGYRCYRSPEIEYARTKEK